VAEKNINTSCCISGGGPAGMMLGLLLARAGIETTVLEKWPDFFRDFRGDTIHPSVMEILHELGLLDDFLKLPHTKMYNVEAEIGKEKVMIADFSHLRVKAPYIALIPQWDFLNFIADRAKKYPTFHLLMETKATDIIKDGGNVLGVMAKNKEGDFEIRSQLVIAADGRHSRIRDKSGLSLKTSGSPMDVLWFRISRKQSDSNSIMGKFDLGRIIIMINRETYWQCGYLIRKGEFDNIKSKGIDSFRQNIIELAPELTDRVQEIKEWEQVKLLTVTVNHLEKWYCPGLLCIGDSAHAMSPIGGVGINLAIQDAIAAANILVPAFLKGKIWQNDLKKVQTRRELPVKIIQGAQVFIQNRIIGRSLGNNIHAKLPLPLKVVRRFPYLQRIPAYLVGIGFRPEHVKNAGIGTAISKQ
jgi:2-polyprenyl-6-methoxyphenol hydroxylase-like FAD-dependent oxidoreductase